MKFFQVVEKVFHRFGGGRSLGSRRRRSSRQENFIRPAALESRCLLDGIIPSTIPGGSGTTSGGSTGTITPPPSMSGTTSPAGTGTVTGSTNTSTSSNSTLADQLQSYINAHPTATLAETAAWLLTQIDPAAFAGTDVVSTVSAQMLAEGVDPSQLATPAEPVNPQAAPPANPQPPNPQLQAPYNLPNFKLVGIPQTENRYDVYTRLVWDEQMTTSFNPVDGSVLGLFNYVREVMSTKTTITRQNYEYSDPNGVASAQADLAAKQAEKPLLEAEAERLSREAYQLATLSNLMYAQSAKYCVFAGALYFAPGGGAAAAAVLSILAGIYGAAGAAAGQASGNKGVQAAAAATKAVKMQDDIEALQLKLATGVGFTPQYGQIVTTSDPIIRPWTPAPALMGATSWQPCDYIGLASYYLGATNLGSSVLGVQLVASTTNWNNLGMWQPYVPE